MKLANKHRPLLFDHIIGQVSLVRVLKKIVQLKSYEAAYMFSGPPGVGKTTTGRVFAKAILCENIGPEGNPCLSCSSCESFQKEQHYGFRELDAASYGGKEDMVKLRDDASYESVGGKKIILIDECQDISKQGQDSLLKQLEQCPPHLIYLFCTTDPEKMNKTLRDRCMEFQLGRVNSKDIVDRLRLICSQEGLVVEDGPLCLISDLSGGHVRNAINLLEEVSYLEEITLESIRSVSKNFDDEICTLLSCMGSDLNKALVLCQQITVVISVTELYNTILALLTDTAKLIYGYDMFTNQRKVHAQKLKDVHGLRAVEFLSYLMGRDRYVDKIGLQSDLILLHYKFCSDAFKPRISEPTKSQDPVLPVYQSPEVPQERSSDITHARLSKMSMEERSRVLREQRLNQKTEQTKDNPRVPTQWPLPKEDKIGQSSSGEGLSPEEFSRLLVGGRGGPI